jgi:hypothetical protein
MMGIFWTLFLPICTYKNHNLTFLKIFVIIIITKKYYKKEFYYIMTSLKLGKNTLSDLANWFNISVSAFRHNKEKYLKILEDYAVFELRGNKNKSVYITEILNPYYDKGQAYDLIKKLTEKNWDYEHLDTCTHVAKKNYPEIIEAGFDIKETTNVKYTRRSKTEMFGKAGDNIGGSLGFCEY